MATYGDDDVLLHFARVFRVRERDTKITRAMAQMQEFDDVPEASPKLARTMTKQAMANKLLCSYAGDVTKYAKYAPSAQRKQSLASIGCLVKIVGGMVIPASSMYRQLTDNAMLLSL